MLCIIIERLVWYHECEMQTDDRGLKAVSNQKSETPETSGS